MPVSRAEAELERFFTLSLDFLCISSADGYFKRASPAVTDILGWSVEEFLSRPFIDFVHPDDVEATLREVEKQIVAGEKILHFENRYRHKDGSWRVLSWRSMPQPDGLMYATARDVTELKAAEESLRDANVQLEERVRRRTLELAQANASLQLSERKFRALIENSGDSISLIDADNNILYLSPAVSAVEGYTAEELMGRSGIENTHPDDLPLVRRIVEELVANPGRPIPVLWRRRHKDGRWLWLEGVATNLLDDPAVRGIVTNYRDVTERKESEARQQAQLVRLGLLSQITRAIGERQDPLQHFPDRGPNARSAVASGLRVHLPLQRSLARRAHSGQHRQRSAGDVAGHVGTGPHSHRCKRPLTLRARRAGLRARHRGGSVRLSTRLQRAACARW